MHCCAGRRARWVAAHWVLLWLVVWGVDARVLVFLEVFLGFVFFGLVVAEFEEGDGEERHLVCGDVVMVGRWLEGADGSEAM